MFNSAYIVSETDVFDIQNFPAVHRELAIIRQHTVDMYSEHKAEIIISFLKNHMIKSEWVRDHPEIVAMITSGEADIKNLERLFSGCKENAPFVFDLQNYIGKMLLSYS